MSVAERIAREVAKDSLRPYVEQALHDEELHARARKAYRSGHGVYEKLRTEPDLRAAANRIASDRKLQKELRSTLLEVQEAARRIGRRPRRRRRVLRTVTLAAGVGVAVLLVSRRTVRSQPRTQTV